jgi:hypothetical protein
MPQGVQAYRRALFSRSKLVPVGALAAKPADVAPSPRFAELERKFDAAFKAVLETLSRAAEAFDTGSENANDLEQAVVDWSAVSSLAQQIMAEPAKSDVDLAIQLAVWEAAIQGAQTATTIATSRHH